MFNHRFFYFYDVYISFLTLLSKHHLSDQLVTRIHKREFFRQDDL